MKITGDILEVLGSAHPDGTLLYLDGRLPTTLYQRVDALLQTAGGRWDRQLQAHVFPGPAWDAVRALTAQEEVTTAAEAKQAAGWFASPPDVVEQLLELAAPEPWMMALEPSAGQGAIAIPLAQQVQQVDAIELDPDRAAALAQAAPHIHVLRADFLRHQGGSRAGRYDLVVMNPPFNRGADVRHVTHALSFLRPGGRMVAVMAASVRERQDKAAVALRRMMGQRGGWFADLPGDAFAASGTTVATVIAVIPSQPGPRRLGEPVRVTFDRTAGRVPLFTPALAAGAYVHRDSWGSGQDRVFRHTGRCIGCGVPTWRHDDGQDDVRGAFGDYTAMPIDEEDLDGAPPGTSFPRCAGCWGECERYEHALALAQAELTRARPIQPAGVVIPVADGPQLSLFEVA